LLTSNLLFYHKFGDKWQTFLLPPEVKATRPPGTPLGLEVWKENIWVATTESLWCFHVERQWWEQFSYPTGVNGGIIHKSPNHRLWVEGIAYFDGQVWEILPPCPIPLSFWPKTPQCFTWDKKGWPWLATVQGVYFFDNQYKCWRSAPGEKLQRVYSITYFQNEIWCTVYDDSLYKFTGAGWEKVASSNPRLNLAHAHALYSTPAVLWFNSYFGVGSFDGTSWVSHYDSREYHKLHTWEMITLMCVILLLSLGIIGFLYLGRVKRYIKRRPI
jgi:hypothetical protein